jgi:hypothetical protein
MDSVPPGEEIMIYGCQLAKINENARVGKLYLGLDEESHSYQFRLNSFAYGPSTT